jgi:hypothetical protein
MVVGNPELSGGGMANIVTGVVALSMEKRSGGLADQNFLVITKFPS